PIKALERQGVQVTVISCTEDGTLNPNDITAALQPNTRLIAMLHGSNVLGTILPLAEIGAIARQHGITFLVDAAQTAGTIPIDMQSMGIDLLAFPGHKGLFGPHGTGGLVVGKAMELATWVEGGSGVESALETMPTELPARLEAGTQNAVGIAGLLAGLHFIQEIGLETIRRHESDLCEILITELGKLPEVKILGALDPAQRTAVVSVTVEGYIADQLAMVLDQAFDIATRAGLHCAPQAHRTAGTLESGALRFSPGYFNTAEEIIQAVDAFRSII
ncbi:MAG: aminotransferase class V-fold PLP-dependent enzyme, partial [Anaerolineales bacterium]